MTFAGIVGHDRAVRGLRAAVAAGRPAHAYLITGPVGVGKATLARALTASLVCDAPRGVGSQRGHRAAPHDGRSGPGHTPGFGRTLPTAIRDGARSARGSRRARIPTCAR